MESHIHIEGEDYWKEEARYYKSLYRSTLIWLPVSTAIGLGFGTIFCHMGIL